MTCSLEAAFNAVGHLYGQENILGVYDAPIKFPTGNVSPLSSLAINIAEQVKNHQDVSEAVAISLRAPAKKEDDDEDSPRVKEINSDSEI